MELSDETFRPPSHRPDIDGLRALAVVPVVLFHTHLTPMRGGFIGVDVFFVISGYLITTLIVADLHRGEFSLARFYERRVRRIMPALATVLAVAGLLAYQLLLPDDMMAFAKSLGAAVLFSSNILFASQAGYFDQPSETKPLLHTWSLGVEEQFYVLYPLFLVLAVRLFGRRYVALTAAVLVASFAMSLWGLVAARDATFYLAPSRIWELLVGALLAGGVLPRIRHQLPATLVGIAGLGSIGYGVLAFSSATPFPGPNALFPVLGAAMVIHSGTEPSSLVRRALGARPIVLVGLISYSLYLWHWVLLVFVRYYLIRPPTRWETGAAVVAAVGFAWLSWRFVEAPFRGPMGIGSRGAVFSGALGLGVAFLALAGIAVFTDGLPNRFGSEPRRLLAAKDDVWARRGACSNAICHLGAPGTDETFILWGDSHANSLAPALEEVAVSDGRAGLVASTNGCAPLLRRGANVRDHEACAALSDSILSLIDQRQIRNVVLHARWAFYAEGEPYGNEGSSEDQGAPSQRVATNVADFEPLLRGTIEELRRRHLNVALLASVPEAGLRVPTALARKAASGARVDIAPRYQDFVSRQRRAFAALRRVGIEFSVPVSFPHEALCDATTCSIERDGHPLYVDADHLSMKGALVLKPMLAAVLLHP